MNERSFNMIEKIPLKWCHLQFEIAPKDTMSISLYPAMTIRGGLGYAMKEQLHQHHLYEKLFVEHQGERVNGQYIAYNRPMIIRTGINHQKIYRKHETYKFDMILFGDVIDAYKEIIMAMVLFGRAGIGKDQSPFYIKRITMMRPPFYKVICDNGEWVSQIESTTWSQVEGAITSFPEKIKLDFKTPLRLKVNGAYQQDVPFTCLVENIARRVKSILHYHQGITLPTTFVEEMTQKAMEVEEVYRRFSRKSYKRYSTRQEKTVYLDGIEGFSIVKGAAIQELFPLLYVGQFLHVGKQSMFGLGQYDLFQYE